MKFSKALFATLFLLVAFSQQIWTTAQFSLPMACSDEKESCIWYEEGMTAPVSPLFFILPTVVILTVIMGSTLRASGSTFTPAPVRIASRQLSRVQRE